MGFHAARTATSTTRSAARLTRYDDFSLEFDLRLSDIASGVEPGKTGPLQIGLGLLNLAVATSTNFMRGAWGSAPDVAEFAYYTSGYYDYGGRHLSFPRQRGPVVYSGRPQLPIRSRLYERV